MIEFRGGGAVTVSIWVRMEEGADFGVAEGAFIAIVIGFKVGTVVGGAAAVTVVDDGGVDEGADE